MSIEQLESAILGLPPEERRRLVAWLDEHRHELFSRSSISSRTALLRPFSITPVELANEQRQL